MPAKRILKEEGFFTGEGLEAELIGTVRAVFHSRNSQFIQTVRADGAVMESEFAFNGPEAETEFTRQIATALETLKQIPLY